MIKELIETEKELRNDANRYNYEILDKLRLVFHSILLAYKKNSQELIGLYNIIDVGAKDLMIRFDGGSVLDKYWIDNEMLFLHYYYRDNSEDTGTFKIPLEVVEKNLECKNNEVVLSWYNQKLDECRERYKEHLEKMKTKQEEEELAELKRLQEKYKDRIL